MRNAQVSSANSRLQACCVAALLWLLSLPSQTQAVEVMLDANESPPFWSIELPYDGMCGEIVHAISSEVGLNSYIRFFPLTRLIEDDSNNDLGNPQFYMASQDFEAVIPVAIYNTAVFYHKPKHDKKPSFRNLEDLKGYKIGVLKGTLANFSKFEKAGISFEESYTQKSLFKKLKRGRVDLVVEIELLGRNMIKKLYPEEAEDFAAEAIPGSAAPIAILLDDDYPDATVIGDQYRLGLSRIIDNGRYQKILDKYYEADDLPVDWFENLERFDRIYNYRGND